MPKRKERPTGLKKGNEHGSCAKITKKSKANKENFTVYVASLESGSESEPDGAFSSLPVHGTLARPHKLKKKTKIHQLRPLDTGEDSETLPDLEAVSDNEDEDDESGMQADNEEDDKGPDDDLEELRASWDHQSYAEAWKSFGVDKEATGPSPDTFSRPVAPTDDDQEMPYEPYSQVNRSQSSAMQGSSLTAHASTPTLHSSGTPQAFGNPWLPQPAAFTAPIAPSAPTNPWLFSFSASSGGNDDEYFEEFSENEDGGPVAPEDERYESMEDEPADGNTEDDTREYTFTSPTVERAQAALKLINDLLRPPRKTGAGYKKCELHLYTRTRLEWMASFLHLYCSEPPKGTHSVQSRWISASLAAAHAAQKGPWAARKIRQWTRAFMKDSKDLPKSPYGKWNRERSILADADVSSEIALHLQSVGKYVKAMDIVHYIDRPEVKRRLGLKKGIHLSTAQRWMKDMGYRWKKKPHGQYVDGHERADVVYYRQTEYVPAFTELEYQTRKWTLDNLEMIRELPANQIIVVWFHDESTFHANDRRLIRWVHQSETAEPRAKGEGCIICLEL
ncbi:hypothetical protein R3P38DRAFT_2758972 [Favolaschia claudopus]|uniref:Uncharacterized protein n=1 Tax=Favolaschia claudopus TaxID=2862362 RepID=A0AAW0E679_9AGAR